MKNKIYLAFIAFVFTFCAPALIVNAVQTYNAAGHELGKTIYEATHESSL
jgi:hypothetical protein